jgi:hypothetical protein
LSWPSSLHFSGIGFGNCSLPPVFQFPLVEAQETCHWTTPLFVECFATASDAVRNIAQWNARKSSTGAAYPWFVENEALGTRIARISLKEVERDAKDIEHRRGAEAV